MGDITYGQTVDMLKNALTGASDSHAVFANNIANVNTPGFKRTDVSFKQALAQSVPETPDPDQLQMAITNQGDITTDPTAEVIPFSVHSNVDDTQQLRLDGSNVDIDQEMAKALAERRISPDDGPNARRAIYPDPRSDPGAQLIRERLL